MTAARMPKNPVQNGRAMSVSVTQQSSFSGPLPPPEVLGLYNEIIPNVAERLVASFEGQQSHRHQMESQVISAGIRRAWYGLWCGFVVALAGLGVAALAVVYQQQWAATVVGGGTLVGMVTVFVTGRHQQERERTSRRENLEKK